MRHHDAQTTPKNRLSFLSLVLLATLATTSRASAEAGSVSCAVAKDTPASLFVDPWANGPDKVQRFGMVESSDDVSIQNCRGITDQYLALTIGNREASLAAESANIITSAQLGVEQCKFSPGIETIPWLNKHSEREDLMRTRLKTLRSCVALEVTSLSGRKLILGNHPSCKWTASSSTTYVARGTTCTLKIDPGFAVSVKPVIEEACLSPAKFDSGEIRSADLTTSLQTYITSDETAKSTQDLIGVSARRIVIAPSPKLAPFNEDAKLRFSKSIDLKIQPTALSLLTQRTKSDVSSYVAMQLLVRNLGSASSAYPVPLAAEAELLEIRDTNGRPTVETVATWNTFASGQTLIPADWSGLFVTDRAAIDDFAFKHGRRYRIRLKYYHPQEVPDILAAEFRIRPPEARMSNNSYIIPKIQLVPTTRKIPPYPAYPKIGFGPRGNDATAQLSAIEKSILQFFRELGVDHSFPPRYDRSCNGNDCVSIENASFIGNSVIDFTAEATPGQVSEMRAVAIESTTQMISEKSPSKVEFAEPEGIRCR